MARPRTSCARSTLSQELPRLSRARRRLRKPPRACPPSVFDWDPSMDDLGSSAYCSGELAAAGLHGVRQAACAWTERGGCVFPNELMVCVGTARQVAPMRRERSFAIFNEAA